MGYRRKKKELQQASAQYSADNRGVSTERSDRSAPSNRVSTPGAVAVNENRNSGRADDGSIDTGEEPTTMPHIPDASLVVPEPPRPPRAITDNAEDEEEQPQVVCIGQEAVPQERRVKSRAFLYVAILVLAVAVAILTTLLLVKRDGNNETNEPMGLTPTVDASTLEPVSPSVPPTPQPSIAMPLTAAPTSGLTAPPTTMPMQRSIAPTSDPTASSMGEVPGIEECPHVSSNRPLLEQAPTVLWEPVGSDILGEEAGNWFGYSAAFSCDGRILASGSAFSNVAGFRTGQARVFTLDDDDDDWVQLGQDLDGESAGEDAGRSVALSADGKIVAVGALSAEESVPARPGRTRVYKYDVENSSWTQLGSDVLGEAPGDRFGTDVALSADGMTLAVTALLDDQAGTDAGRAYVFEYDETTSRWSRRGSALSGSAGDWFGYRIDLSSDGDVVAVGNAREGGYARVYGWNRSDWVRRGLDIRAKGRGFIAVSLSSNGNILAVGDRFHNEGLTNVKTGRVAVYLWNGNAWVPRGAEIISGEAAEDLFGRSVALSSDGSLLAVGATGFDDVDATPGKVGVFLFDGDVWMQVGSYLVGEVVGDSFGGKVALSGDGSRLVATSLLHDGGNGVDSGKVQTFQVVVPK